MPESASGRPTPSVAIFSLPFALFTSLRENSPSPFLPLYSGFPGRLPWPARGRLGHRRASARAGRFAASLPSPSAWPVSLRSAHPSALLFSFFIHRAFNQRSISLKHMGIDHCCRDIVVSHQFLNISYIASRLQEMRGEGMTKGMTAYLARHIQFLCRYFKRSLKSVFVNMMTADLAGPGVRGKSVRRKNVLLDPFLSSVRVFPFK